MAAEKKTMELTGQEFEEFAKRLDYTIKLQVQKEAAAGNFDKTDDLLGLMHAWVDLWKGDCSSVQALLFPKPKS